MAVYYKFKSAKDYDSIAIEGQFISVANLKERIFESKHLLRGTDFDLMVSNAQSNDEYVDEDEMIPKNTSILIRRIPGRPRYPIVTERAETKIVEDKIEDISLSSSMMIGDSSAMKYPEESEWDEFGNDLYSIPEVHHPSRLLPYWREQKRAFSMPAEMSSAAAAAAGQLRRSRGSSGVGQNVSCLVDGCKSDLSHLREYHMRHKVCEVHSKTPVVLVGGQEQRFCQQCSRSSNDHVRDRGRKPFLLWIS